MALVNKPDESIFASSAKQGEVDNFPDLLRGWGITFEQTQGIPPMEWFNFLFKRLDEKHAYLMQRGLPEWSATQDYTKGSCVQFDGVSYRALKNSKNNSPNESNSQYWVRWGFALSEIARATLTQYGLTQLYTGYNSQREDLALTPKTAFLLKQLIDSNTRAIGNVIPNSKKSSAVNSNSNDTVATSAAVKSANDNANSRIAKSGDTMTGALNIRYGDYSFINQFNNSGKFARIEVTPDDQSNFYKLSYWDGNSELHSALLPKRGDRKIIAYEDWVNDGYVPLNKRSSAVNSKDENNVATSKAVKTAYDKGVEAKNAADGANNNANGRVSKSGDTMTGPLNIKFGDYSFINQFNLSGKFARIETTPDDQSNFYKLSYWSGDTELHSALLPKRGAWKVIAYEDWVNDGYVPRTGDTLINGRPTFENNGGFITIKSTGVQWSAIDYKMWNSPVPLVTTQAEDLGNFSGAFNIFTTPEGTDYNTDRREKTAQIHHNGRIWSKRYGWLDEQFAPANDTHKKSRCHNHWFPSHYAGTEVVDLPVDDTGGIRMTLMNVKVNDYHSPYVDIYLPMAYSGFVNAIASDDGSEALGYGTDMIGNNIVRVYCKRSGNIGFRLHVIGWANF